jgi:hypothetical protein
MEKYYQNRRVRCPMLESRVEEVVNAYRALKFSFGLRETDYA